ncbi:MAG: Crp/Fnr family transcriptional regulator [Lachnospiraceae bacterium]|nr:Crp/Fnr family transcriptional regulator [Lachnospiraceae bacterium]
MLELVQTELFKEISQESIMKMMRCSKAIQKEYEAGQYIFREEDKPEFLYLILQGRVSVVKDFASGRQDILYVASAGSVFGEDFFQSGQTRYWFDAIAEEPATLLLLPWRFFFGFCSNACEHHQQINKNMLEILSEKNSYMTKKAHILSSTTLREKISVWLLENARDNEVELPMNREQMAAYLGVTRPSLSRELMKMQKENRILLEKNSIKILNL